MRRGNGNQRTDEGAAEARGASALPRDWLPEGRPSPGDGAWEGPLARILAAAGPEMARRVAAARTPAQQGWTEIRRWWRPVAALSAAASTLLLFVERPAALSSPEAITLSLLTEEGDPTVLWEAMGSVADPILALVALQDHTPFLVPLDDANSAEIRP